MRLAPNAWDKIKVADVVVSTNHVIFLTNRFPRLMSLPTFGNKWYHGYFKIKECKSYSSSKNESDSIFYDNI